MARAAAPAPVLRNRIVGQADVPPGDLVANPNNWRTHPKAQRAALAGALEEVGWVQQVLVNTTTGRMVDGHARAEEALRRGEPTVPVLYVELSEAEERTVLATLDPIAAMAQADDDQLRALLAEVTVLDDGLAALLANLAAGQPKAGLTDPDAVPEPAAAPWVKPGDCSRSAATGSCAATRRSRRTSTACSAARSPASLSPTRPTASSSTWSGGTTSWP